MIKQIITIIVLLFIALAVFSLAKTIQPDVPKGKLPADSVPVGASSDIENVTWVWTETIVNNDTSITPKRPGVFSITLTDGNVAGKTDCNSFFSTYQIGTDGVISFGPIGSTKMACEGSEEAIFTDFISKTSRYTLDANKNLVLLLEQDSGSVMFKKAESKNITLSIGEKSTVGDFTITLNKFVQDSRCPIDVQCIQAGAVTVNVTLTDGVKTETKNFPSDEAPQNFGVYKISIFGIEPARESTKEIADKDYKITFRVEK
jgi:heat shock protein HslJ